MATTLTWLGHSAFRVDTPGGKRVYVDPYLDNPFEVEAYNHDAAGKEWPRISDAG